MCISTFFHGGNDDTQPKRMPKTVIFLEFHANLMGWSSKFAQKYEKNEFWGTGPILCHITIIISTKYKIFPQTCFLSLWKKFHKSFIWIFPDHDQMNIIWRDLPTNGKIQPKIRIFDGLQAVVSRLPSGVGGRASALNLSTHPGNAFSGL